MNRAYWDNLAATYDQQIFSVWRSDHARRLHDLIVRHGGPGRSAADLGCGPGQITPLLAQHFGVVHALDLSDDLLQQARTACAGKEGVAFHCHDLAADEAPFAPVDFVLCVNVILTADLEQRERLWERVTSLVAAGGRLVLVVPSHESALYTDFRWLDWQVRQGSGAAEALEHSRRREGGARPLEHGVRTIEGVATKHYLREELIVQLEDRSLQVQEIHQLTHDWTTEFTDPPEWMGRPWPWNWLVVAGR